MSAFERRGLPARDVLDRSFDEIQRIGYLDLAESRRVLESRVTGVPVPFQCLCHCLAGGLPRDLIRSMRELVYHHNVEAGPGGGGDESLENPARALAEGRMARESLRRDRRRSIARVAALAADDLAAHDGRGRAPQIIALRLDPQVRRRRRSLELNRGL